MAEFESSKEAYTFAAYVHGRFEYRDMTIILEDVVRMTEMAPREAVRLAFTPSGMVVEGAEVFRKHTEKRIYEI